MPLQITITGNELHDFIRVAPGADDAAVAMLLVTAKVEAEQFLNTDFSATDTEGVTTPTEAPDTVKAWVFNRVGQLYDNRGVTVKPDYTLLQLHRVYPFNGNYTPNTTPSVLKC